MVSLLRNRWNVHRIGPFDNQEVAEQAATNAQAQGEFDILDQQVYLVGPDHRTFMLTEDDVTGQPMRKLNIEVEAVVMLPVKVKLGLLVRADDDASVDRIVKQFAKGNLRTSKADVEDVEIEAAEVEDDLDADEPLAAHVGKLLEDGGRITVTASRVTDSR